MFENLIVQPILNLLIFLYALLPGHNFGLALILFTAFVRLIMHPFVKKQLHHSKAMRELQPEIDAIKKSTKGDKQKAAELTMELYKERSISPFSSLGTIAVQVIVLIGLYAGIRKIADDPNTILSNSYEWLKNLGTLKELAADITKFDFSLFGLVDLSRTVSGSNGFYFPALVLVGGSSIAQYYMGKQTLPEEKQAGKLRKILRQSFSRNKQSEQSTARALWDNSIKYIIPVFIFIFTYGLPCALALYWMVSGIVGYYQQRQILKQDETELLPSKKPKTSNKKRRLSRV